MHAVVLDIDGTILQSNVVDDILYREAVLSVLGTIQLRTSFADYDNVSDSGILSQILTDNSIAEDPELVGAVKTYFVESLRTHITANGPLRRFRAQCVLSRNSLAQQITPSQ